MTQIFSVLLFSLMQMLGVGERVEIVFAGDAMQHSPQIAAALRDDGTYDYSQCFELIEDDIRGADFAVVNLEVPLGGKPYSGYPVFSAPDDYARQLKASGFDLLITANNHCLDRGSKGLLRTLAVLDSIDMASIGTYVSQERRDEIVPYIGNVKGCKIAMLAYTYGTNGFKAINGVVDMIDRAIIKKDISEARENGAQVVCVNLHWGTEYMRLPDKAQRSLTDFLVDEGVDLIIGGHPHVVQPMEMRYSYRHEKDVLVVYSLGNFISNQNDIDGRGGAMVKAELILNDGEVAGIRAGYKLLFCQKPKKGVAGDNYRLIPGSCRDSVRADSQATFDEFMERTRSLLTTHNSDDIKELK